MVKFLVLSSVFIVTIQLNAGQLHVQQFKGAQYIWISGYVDSQLLGDIKSFKGLKGIDLSKNTIFLLDNPGGFVYESIEFASELWNFAQEISKRSGHAVNIVVAKQCHSMCIPIFTRMAAFSRIYSATGAKEKSPIVVMAKGSAKWGFHGPSIDSKTIDKQSSETYKKMLAGGFAGSKQWVAKNEHLFNSTTLTYKTTRELVNESSAIVLQEEMFW